MMIKPGDGPDKEPENHQFTPQELAQFNGTDDSKPVYLAVKGVVFDVTKSREMYQPGKSYSVFAGRDASRALGMSSVKIEDCSSDYSSLSKEEMETLDKWLAHYTKKYNIVGRV